MNILLVEPEFPLPPRSKNHANFLPIGLLKIAAYHRSIGDNVELHRGNYPATVNPDEIKITSLFTYWSEHVWASVQFYKNLYPRAPVQVGGIYASLLPEHAKLSGCDIVEKGLYRNGAAESFLPAYDLVDVDYQIIHASRGCFRHCNFCGTWKIEPEVSYKFSIRNEIVKKNLVFYDNNLLTNPHIENILAELAEYKFPNKSSVSCESQSGLDGRVLSRNPKLAKQLKNAHFKNPRIAWDGPYSRWPEIKAQIACLKEAGFASEYIFIFMLYNHRLPFKELRAKLNACRRWQVRVIDCRYRPLDSTSDKYKPRLKHQEPGEYFIHKGWTDLQVRAFRRSVRRQNIAIMLGLPNGRYIPGVEKGYVSV